jgi:segregation and condensation protein B
VSTNIVKTLEEREWVRVVGYRDVPGKPALFGTSRNFLDYFNLKSLDELPALAEIHEIEDFDPQLTLGPVAPAENDSDSGENVEEAASSAAHESTHDTMATMASASLPAFDGDSKLDAVSTDAAPEQDR